MQRLAAPLRGDAVEQRTGFCSKAAGKTVRPGASLSVPSIISRTVSWVGGNMTAFSGRGKGFGRLGTRFVSGTTPNEKFTPPILFV
ncbi:hypothetical protein NPIL_291621 [Nephila pilipes]|uniref:Uncharacterized protein n=1 Tax=Nephila pilipes TaxID=299642 RepID=A0A8X6MW13_NEPPI|nr:hypothetical protein NPIL_291621 [Nephila pilipes]